MEPKPERVSITPLVKLASSAVPGEKKYVLFAGAGLSRDAGLPTGWDLMLATAARVKAGEDGDSEEDCETWFKNSQYAEMSYAELIGSLFTTAVEQQQFMHEQLKADKPSRAHRLTAELAKRGVIRCVITTNFDTLLEQALEEVGLKVQVIANVDDLRESEPLIHCKSFRVYKPHGTLGVGRIRNTPVDLRRLPPEIEEELIRVMSDHGLMVLGYAGQDEGISCCFKRRRHHLYPTFWINPNPCHDSIPAWFGSETFQYIECKGAASFLDDLLGMYRRLADLTPAVGLSGLVVNVRDSIVAGKRDSTALVDRFIEAVAEDVLAIAPNYKMGGESDEILVQAIQKTIPIVIEAANIAAVIAEAGSSTAARAFYKSYGRLLEGYDLPIGFSGEFCRTDFDFFKFVGHEIFVTFFSFLIKYERWDDLPPENYAIGLEVLLC